MLLVAIWASVGFVIALYILFIVWRVRVDRRKKAMVRSHTDIDSTLSSVIARAEASMLPDESSPSAPVAMAEARPAPESATSSAATVADALHGISLPNDLAPLTSMAPRGDVGDRVAFWTKVPAEVVGPAFGDELERLGYTIKSIDAHTLAAQRGDARLVAIIHPDGQHAMIAGQRAFPTVPELATVIEVWLVV